MTKFLAGVVTGIVISTIGVSGMARILDNGVDVVKQQSQTLSR